MDLLTFHRSDFYAWIGPILDDRLKEKILKPWKGALSSHSVCLSVCVCVCVCVCVRARATGHIFWPWNLIFGLSDPWDMRKKRCFLNIAAAWNEEGIISWIWMREVYWLRCACTVLKLYTIHSYHTNAVIYTTHKTFETWHANGDAHTHTNKHTHTDRRINRQTLYASLRVTQRKRKGKEEEEEGKKITRGSPR